MVHEVISFVRWWKLAGDSHPHAGGIYPSGGHKGASDGLGRVPVEFEKTLRTLLAISPDASSDLSIRYAGWNWPGDNAESLGGNRG